MTQYNPLVSIVIPMYNRAHTISDAVNSVLAQTYNNYEIILVDDGSTDNTKEIISKYGDGVVYVYQENSGPSAARNTGIRQAKGELIAFLDSDDVWREDKLACQVACFLDAPLVGIVASGHEIRNQNWELTQTTLLTEKEIGQIHRKDLYKNFFSTPSVIVRAKCFDEVGYFDETIRYAEDWDMWLRILQKYECYIINEPLVSVRVSDTSITSNYSEKNIEEWRRVLEKHNADTNSATLCTNLKQWSWFYLNKSCCYTEKNWFVSKASLVKSIITWPFWYPGRYYVLFKW
ncbi:MAG TPA: family 2 glycosyl transferase [Acinetobacter lwoffii]|nr:family 2 glycosyl transferase [Acinetobacter lwoffii]